MLRKSGKAWRAGLQPATWPAVLKTVAASNATYKSNQSELYSLPRFSKPRAMPQVTNLLSMLRHFSQAGKPAPRELNFG